MKCHKEIISISETSLISELSGPCRFLWHWDYALPSLCLESSTPFHCLCRKSSISIVLQVSNPLCSQEWNMSQVVYVHHYFLPKILNTFCFFMSMLAFTCLIFFPTWPVVQLDTLGFTHLSVQKWPSTCSFYFYLFFVALKSNAGKFYKCQD